jgi:hypothetical protein
MNFVTKVTDWSTYSNITITWMPLPLHIWFFLIFNLSKLFLSNMQENCTSLY